MAVGCLEQLLLSRGSGLSITSALPTERVTAKHQPACFHSLLETWPEDLFKELAIPLYSGDLYQHVLRSMVAKRLGAKPRKNLLLEQVTMRKLTRPSLLRDSAHKSERVSTISPTKSVCDVNELNCVDVLSF
mmetsp:Transcript_26937/g.64968  ORF Transcript_26937/g.64968 Transcript_26937/m.64968 type:complete len:132 (-) Transcript_26937:153-548(-)